MENEGSADTETDYSSEGDEIEDAAGEPQIIGEHGGHGTDNTQNIQPERRADVGEIAAKPDLKQQGGESNGGDGDQSNRAVEGVRSGVDDDQSEGEEEEAGSDHGPSPCDFGVGVGARLRRRGRQATSGQVSMGIF